MNTLIEKLKGKIAIAIMALFVGGAGTLAGVNNIVSVYGFQTMASSGPIAIMGSQGQDAMTIFATNTDALYRSVVNECESPVYLIYGDTPVANSLGTTTEVDVRVAANGGIFEMKGETLFVGTMRATTSGSADCNVLVNEASR